jgi:hypothetical protein
MDQCFSQIDQLFKEMDRSFADMNGRFDELQHDIVSSGGQQRDPRQVA